MPNDDELGINLEGPAGTADPRAVAEAITAVDKLLRNIIAEDEPTLTISHLAIGSAKASIRGDRERIELAQRGLETLSESAVLPEGWTPECVTAVVELQRVSRRRGVDEIQLSIAGAVTVVDAVLAENAEASIAPGPPTLGGTRGMLYRYHGGKRTAGMRDARTGLVVELSFPEHLAPDVRSALDQVVEVWGTVTRDAAQRIKAIDIVGLEVEPLSREAVTLEQVAGILGPGWTGGIDTVEWVRQQRD